MNNINNAGEFTPEKTRPDTFNIPHRSELALRHIFELTDPEFDYVTYIGASLCEDPPHFVHHRLDWTEALPYSVHGAITARRITGNSDFGNIQEAQRTLMLKHISKNDGLVYSPASPWNNPYPLDIWEQARTIYALIYCFLDTQDDMYLTYISGMVKSLNTLSEKNSKKRFFSSTIINSCSMGQYGNGALIDPLLKYYELSGNLQAFELAEGMFYSMVDPAEGYFDDTGKFQGFFRSAVSCISGFSKMSLLLNEQQFINRARMIHEYALSRCTSYGSTPCGEPVCSDFELNLSALAFAKSGSAEYWEQIDRFVRNQIAEAQFLDPTEWNKNKAGKERKNLYNIYDGYPDDMQILPHDDYRNIVNRSVGGFMWCSADEHMYFPASLMICCTSHALRSFEIVWENAVIEDDEGIVVNFYYNLENESAEIISYEPFEGKLSVIPRRSTTLKLRIPEYIDIHKSRLLAGAHQTGISVRNNYIIIENAQANTEYTLLYDLPVTETNETQYVYKYPNYTNPTGKKHFTSEWRGNTVIDLKPESTEEKRLYQRDKMKSPTVPYSNRKYFIHSGKRYYAE